MGYLCFSASKQPQLSLIGGALGQALTFAVAPHGRYHVAIDGAYSFEVLPIPLQTLWQARIRSMATGSEVECRIFGFKELESAQSWLQERAKALGGGYATSARDAATTGER
jgi:hypothetical protein